MNKSTDQLASALTKEFFSSETLAFAFQKALQKHRPSLLQVAFAWKVIDRELTRTEPEWAEVRDFAFGSFDELANGNFGNDK